MCRCPDASTSADAPASIVPALPGKWRWVGGLALRFEPDAPLPGATTFRVDVPAGTRSLDGSQLDAGHVVTFTTPRPSLGASDPKDGPRRVEATRPIRLWFNQPIADAELTRAVTITIGASPRTLPFTLTRREGLAVDLTPKTPLPRDAEVHVRVDPSLRAEVGDRLADRAATITFHPLGPLRIESFACTPHALGSSWCDADDGAITLHFSNPVDGEEVKRALTVTPRVPLQIDPTYERTTDVVVRASFAPATTYRLPLPGPPRPRRSRGLSSGLLAARSSSKPGSPPPSSWSGSARSAAASAVVNTPQLLGPAQHLVGEESAEGAVGLHPQMTVDVELFRPVGQLLDAALELDLQPHRR